MLAGVVRVNPGVEVGQLAGLTELVGLRGRISVAVERVCGQRSSRLGHLGDLEIGRPFDAGHLVERIGEGGDLAGGVVAVLGDPVERGRHGRDPVGQVVAVAGVLPVAVGAALELPAQLRAVGRQVVGVRRLRAARVADAEQARGLVRRLRFRVRPVGQERDRRPRTVGGCVGEHERTVGKELAVGLRTATLSEPQHMSGSRHPGNAVRRRPRGAGPTRMGTLALLALARGRPRWMA